MITIEQVAAELHAVSARVDGIADTVDEVRIVLARIEERQTSEAEHRRRLEVLPERVAAIEAAARANAEAVAALDGRGWDRWIAALRALAELLVGTDGYLRSRAGIALLVLLAVAVGAITVEQLAALWAAVPTLVPVPIPQP